MARRVRVVSVFLLIVMIIGSATPVQSQEGTADVESILDGMTSAERVGQLFLVTFFGNDVSPTTDIARLVQEYHVGGVVLKRENDNFSDTDDVIIQTYQMISQLQTLAAGTSADGSEPDTGYVPLFIGYSSAGNSWPYEELITGLTPTASSLSIGATWQADSAAAAGEIAGRELSALGFNLFLGPSADVVEVPELSTSGSLGTNVFGGEAYWVSEMTSAYVMGMHSGSDGRMAVVPGHFPGYGGADRLASVEIPIVRRLLDQLIQVDLQPFFAVTGEAEDPLAVADGLLVGHIRYQGFQGDNPRLPTRPISLEPGPLGALMALDALSSWRADGGLLISDSLGLRGVWRFYDPEESVFPGRRIALDAFSAGNDILYIGNYGTNPRTNQTSAVIDTIEFFIQRYESDTAFQEQVDAAVRRIITRKMALYGEFSLDAVIPAEDGLAQIGSYSAQIYDVARDGLTLLSPDLVDLPAPPQLGENIVIFTDSRSVRQCSSCAFRSIIPIDSLRSSILRFYGPDATGLVSLANVFPFSFTELADYMEREPFVPGEGENTPEPDQLELALTTADWVVFVMVQDDPAVPASLIVKQFLAEMPPSPSIKIVVLAMGSPYYLDSTEISKLSAYYALYGYTSPYIDVAARALFQELLPTGASPVSVAGIEYDILTATSPDPLQIIQISFAIEGAEEAGTAEQTAVPELIVDQGDALILTTGLIVDHNGHPVPDGTPVDFVLTYTNEGLRDTRSAVTQDGIAQISATIARPGQVLITAESGEARNSVTILLTTGSPDISVVAPELPPTSTPVPTETPLPAPTLSASPTDLTVEATPATVDAERAVSFSDLFLSMIGLSVLGAAVFAAGYLTRDSYYGGLLALAATLGGLFGYNYYALLLPGALGWREVLGETWAAALATWIGAGIGCAVAFGFYVGWQRWLVVFLRQRQRKDSSQ